MYMVPVIVAREYFHGPYPTMTIAIVHVQKNSQMRIWFVGARPSKTVMGQQKCGRGGDKKRKR